MQATLPETTFSPVYGTFSNSTYVVTIIKVDLDVGSRVIVPKTYWPDAPTELISASMVDISVSTVPAGFEDDVVLSISDVTPGEPMTGDGTLTRDSSDSSMWHYESFSEDKAEKHPVLKRIDFSATLNEEQCASGYVLVATVFRQLSAPVPGTYTQDRESAWRYAKWKYDVSTAGLTSIAYDSAQSEFGLTSTITDACTIGPAAFISENQCASTLTHENVHGDQPASVIIASQLSWSLGFSDYCEVEAYNVELVHSAANGLSSGEIENITIWRDYYNREGPHPDE